MAFHPRPIVRTKTLINAYFFTKSEHESGGVSSRADLVRNGCARAGEIFPRLLVGLSVSMLTITDRGGSRSGACRFDAAEVFMLAVGAPEVACRGRATPMVLVTLGYGICDVTD